MSVGVPRAALLLPLVLLAFLAACGLNKPDLSYRDSRLHEPLQVPPDLAGPTHSSSMEIPSPGAPSAAVPEGADIELPPDLRADAPASGAGEEQD